MTTLATLFWIRNVDSLWGQTNIEKLFSLGDFNTLTGESSNFSIWELILFTIVGCMGGLLGAVFNAASEHLTLWRMKHVNQSKCRRFVEVLGVTFVVSVVSFLMPIFWGRCTQLPQDMQDWTNQEKNLVEALVPFRCIPGKEYNEVASLMLTQADIAIKQLFHFREAGADDTSTFSSGALFLFSFTISPWLHFVTGSRWHRACLCQRYCPGPHLVVSWDIYFINWITPTEPLPIRVPTP